MICEQDVACEGKSYKSTSTFDEEDNQYVFTKNPESNRESMYKSASSLQSVRPVLILNVGLGSGKSEKLLVYRDEDPASCTDRFCHEFGIHSENAREKILRAITTSLKSAVAFVDSQIQSKKPTRATATCDREGRLVVNNINAPVLTNPKRPRRQLQLPNSDHYKVKQYSNISSHVASQTGTCVKTNEIGAKVLSDSQREALYNKHVNRQNTHNHRNKPSRSRVRTPIGKLSRTQEEQVVNRLYKHKPKNGPGKTRSKSVPPSRRRQRNTQHEQDTKVFDRLYRQAHEFDEKLNEKRLECEKQSTQQSLHPRSFAKQEFKHLEAHLHGTLSALDADDEYGDCAQASERLYMQGLKAKEWKEKFAKKERSKALDAALQDCSFHPNITKYARSLRRPLQAWAMPRESDKDQELYRRMRQERLDEQVRSCTFKPEISEMSKRIAWLSQLGFEPITRSRYRDSTEEVGNPQSNCVAIAYQHSDGDLSNLTTSDSETEVEYASFIPTSMCDTEFTCPTRDTIRSPSRDSRLMSPTRNATRQQSPIRDANQLFTGREPNNVRNSTPLDPHSFLYASRFEYKDIKQ